MKRVRTRLGAVTVAMALGATALATLGGTAQALSNPNHPVLNYQRIITSHPFNGAPGNAIDVEGLGSVPDDTSMWVADDNGDRVWEIDPTTGAYKSQLRGGNPSTNPANIDFTTATNVVSGQTCGQALDGAIVGDTADNECLSRTDDFESAVYDSSADVLYVTSGNCCTAGLPVGYPYHPTVWKLTRVGGHFKPAQWQALPEGTDPTAAGLRPGDGLYFGHSKKVQTYDFASNTLGADATLPVSADIVGLDFTSSSTVFVTSATPNTSSGRTTATSDSTIQRFDISGSSWTKNTLWTFPLKNIGVTGGSVADDGMIDARDLAIIGDTFYVSDGYDGRSGGDHPIYVYTLGNAPQGGYIVDGQGGLHPYASGSGAIAPPTSGGPYWNYNIARGVAVLPDGTGGYIVDGQGGLHPFSIAGHAAPPQPVGGPYWNYDIARGVTFTADGKGGYVVDGQGGLHPFKVGAGGTAPAQPVGGPYWNYDIARGVAIAGSGGYVSDGQGGLHPFKVGAGGTAPAQPVGGPYWNYDIARGVTVQGTGGYIGDGQGGTHPFKIGNAGTIPPITTGGPYWNYNIAWGIAALQ